MNLSQMKDFSKNAISGNRIKAFWIGISIFLAEVFFRCLEAGFAGFVLYLTDITPLELFYGNVYTFRLFSVACMLVRWIVVASLIPAVVNHFNKLAGMDCFIKPKFFIDIISNLKILKKSFFVLLAIKLCSFIFLIPTLFFSITAYRFIIDGYENSQPDSLFLASHSIVMTFVSLVVWLWALLGMVAVPFINIKDEEKNAFKIIRKSFSVMRNNRMGLIKVLLSYALKLIVPFYNIWCFSEFLLSFSIYINVCIKEAESIEANFCRGYRKTNAFTKIFAKPKRSIKTLID